MMTQTTPQIRALAFTVHAIRPSWPLQLIESSLAKSTKPFDVLADDAIDAARNPELRSPAVLTSHRRPDRPLGEGSQPPPITRCETCGRINSEHHNCKPLKPSPDWHDRRRQLATKYTHLIRLAQDAGDWNTATYLKAEWQHELNSDRDSYRVDILYTPDGAK